MSLSELTQDTQAALALLFDFSEGSLGIVPRVNSTVRTCAEQNGLYAQGRTSGGPVVTNARGCISWHVLRRAADISLGTGVGAEPYRLLGEYWESLGGFWGGRIEGLDDFGHFEWHPGVSIEELCPEASQCDEAVTRSLAIYLPPLGSLNEEKHKILIAALFAAGIFGTWLVLKRKP